MTLKLWQIDERIIELSRRYDELAEESAGELTEALEHVVRELDLAEMARDEKVLACAGFALHLEDEIEMLDRREKKWRDARQRLEKKREWFRQYIMEHMGEEQIKGSGLVVKKRKNQPSLKIDNAETLLGWITRQKRPGEYVKPYVPQFRIAEIKRQVKQGKDVPGVRLEEGEGLVIK